MKHSGYTTQPFYTGFFHGGLICILMAGCANHKTESVSVSSSSLPSTTTALLNEPERIIHSGDLVKITLKLPDRTLGSLEAVEKAGDVPTPEGSFLKASGLSLESFRTNLVAHYAKISGYENAMVSVMISSSPYKVVKYSDPIPTKTPPSKTPETSTKPAPTIYPRIFKSPLTVWEAIQIEGGLPRDVNAQHIRILKSDLTRKTIDCSGKNGEPDGRLIVESGDYFFLVPEDAPVSQIFE